MDPGLNQKPRRRVRYKDVTRSNPAIGTVVVTNTGTPNVQEFAVYTPPVIKTVDRFFDIVGNMQSDFNPCHRIRLKYRKIREVNEFSVGDGASDSTYTFSLCEFPQCNVLGSLDNGFSSLEMSSFLDEFAHQAKAHFETTIDVEASLLNIIAELIGLLTNGTGKLLSLSRRIRTALDAFFELYNKTGDFWLAWNFCIKPTIGDIKGVFKAITTVLKRFKWLKERNHRDTKVKYRRDAKEFRFTNFVGTHDSWVIPGQLTGAPMPAGVRYELDFTVSVKPTSWAWVRYDIPDWVFDDTFGPGILWSYMMNLYNPLDVAWEAVPFSWLIDWFRTTKSKLEQRMLDIGPIPIPALLGEGHSLKMQISGEVYFCTWEHPPIDGEEPEYPNRMKTGFFFADLYTRKVGLPFGESLTPIGSWYQMSIIASLFGGKRRRR